MRSLSDRFIGKALEEGFYVNEDGDIFNPQGEKSNTHGSKTGHLRLTLYIKGLNERGSQSVLAHRLAACFFFGEQALDFPLIRHLNDIPYDNRRSNLQPGTYKENRADIPKEVLSSIAKKQSKSFVERSRTLADNDVRTMRYYRSLYKTPYHRLANVFNVSTMTAQRACTRASWSNLV